MSGRAEFNTLAGHCRGVRMVVIGDVMLDRYQWGRVERVSAEAPVPVLHIEAEESRLGGAANVAHNLQALGAEVRVLGVIGADAQGEALEQHLARLPGCQAELLRDAGRPTTVKLRIMAQRQQLLRCDWEQAAPLEASLQQRLLHQAEAAVAWGQGVIVSDYAKGLVSQALMQALVQACGQAGKPLLVDPKGRDYGLYRGCSCLTPNDGEAHQAAGLENRGLESAAQAARQLLHSSGAGAVCITLGAKGVLAATRQGEQRHFPSQAREVFDVTGAGDTFMSMLAAWWSGGGDFFEAVQLANTAAGLVVGKLGSAATSLAEVQAALERSSQPAAASAPPPLSPPPATTLGQAKAWVQHQQRQGRRVVFTNGCFDLLHAGHVHYLQRSRQLGEALIVGLNSDASVRRLKGSSRPLQAQAARAVLLGALACVDAVVVFEAETPLELIRALRPDVLAKGADYTLEEIAGARDVLGWGGRVERIPLLPGHSTSGLLKRL